jgi:hypothetical protein
MSFLGLKWLLEGFSDMGGIVYHSKYLEYLQISSAIEYDTFKVHK